MIALPFKVALTVAFPTVVEDLKATVYEPLLLSATGLKVPRSVDTIIKSPPAFKLFPNASMS